MAGRVQLALTAEDRDLIRQFEKTKKELAELQRAANGVGDAGEKAFDRTGKAVKRTADGSDKLLSSTASTLKQLMGFGSAVGVLSAVLAKFREIVAAMEEAQNLSKQTMVTLDQARSTAILNLPSTFEGGVAAFDKMMERIAKRSGMTLTDVYRNAGGPLSAKGSATMEQFEDAFALSAGIQRRTGGAVQSGLLAGSILDVMKATGLTDASAALGYIRQIGAAARVQTLEGQMRLVPGLTIGQSVGDTPEKAAELQAAISQMIVDPDGSRTAELYKGMATSLYKAELAPARRINPRTGRSELVFGRVSGADTLERLENLRKIYSGLNETERAEMVKKLSESQIGFLLPALKGEETFLAALSAAQSEITAPSQKSAVFTDEMFQAMDSTGSAKVAAADANTKRYLESISMADPLGAMKAAARELYQGTMKRYGMTSWIPGSQWLSEMAGEVSSGSAAAGLYSHIRSLPEYQRIPLDERERLKGAFSPLIEAEQNAPRRPSWAGTAGAMLSDIPGVPPAMLEKQMMILQEHTKAINANTEELKKRRNAFPANPNSEG